MLPKQFDTSYPALIQDVTGSWTVNKNAANIQRLMYNQRYELQIMLADGQFVGIDFSSSYDPLYTTMGIIRQDIGEIISTVTDDEINFRIYLVGQMAQQLAAASQRYVLFGSPVGNIQLQFRGVIRDEMKNAIPYPVPFYVQQYTRYKTELELVYARYINLSAQAGMVEKDLGDLKIIRQVMIPRIQDVMADLKTNLKEWEDMLRGGGDGKTKWTSRAKAKKYTPGRVGF